MPTAAETFDEKIRAALATLRQARGDDNATLAEIAEDRLNALIEMRLSDRPMIHS